MIITQIFGFAMIAAIGARFGWHVCGLAIEGLESLFRGIGKRLGGRG